MPIKSFVSACQENLLDLFCLAAAWQHWLVRVEEKRRLGRLLARCMARRSRALLCVSLSGWRFVMDDRRALRERLVAMGNRADADLLHRTFAGWLDAYAAQQQQQVNSVLCFLSLSWRLATIYSCGLMTLVPFCYCNITNIITCLFQPTRARSDAATSQILLSIPPWTCHWWRKCQDRKR